MLLIVCHFCSWLHPSPAAVCHPSVINHAVQVIFTIPYSPSKAANQTPSSPPTNCQPQSAASIAPLPSPKVPLLLLLKGLLSRSLPAPHPSLPTSEVQSKMIFMGHQILSCHVLVVRSFFIVWKMLLSSWNVPYDHLQICTNITIQYPKKWPGFVPYFILWCTNIDFSCPKKSHRNVPWLVWLWFKIDFSCPQKTSHSVPKFVLIWCNINFSCPKKSPYSVPKFVSLWL